MDSPTKDAATASHTPSAASLYDAFAVTPASIFRTYAKKYQKYQRHHQQTSGEHPSQPVSSEARLPADPAPPGSEATVSLTLASLPSPAVAGSLPCFGAKDPLLKFEPFASSRSLASLLQPPTPGSGRPDCRTWSAPASASTAPTKASVKRKLTVGDETDSAAAAPLSASLPWSPPSSGKPMRYYSVRDNEKRKRRRLDLDTPIHVKLSPKPSVKPAPQASQAPQAEAGALLGLLGPPTLSEPLGALESPGAKVEPHALGSSLPRRAFTSKTSKQERKEKSRTSDATSNIEEMNAMFRAVDQVELDESTLPLKPKKVFMSFEEQKSRASLEAIVEKRQAQAAYAHYLETIKSIKVQPLSLHEFISANLESFLLKEKS